MRAWSLRGAHATAQVHNPCRRRGGMAARGTRASGRDARIGGSSLTADDAEAQARLAALCEACENWA